MLSVLSWPVIALAYGSLPMMMGGTHFGVFRKHFAEPRFWVALPLTMVIGLATTFFLRGYERAFEPTFPMLIEEVEHQGIKSATDDALHKLVERLEAPQLTYDDKRLTEKNFHIHVDLSDVKLADLMQRHANEAAKQVINTVGAVAKAAEAGIQGLKSGTFDEKDVNVTEDSNPRLQKRADTAPPHMQAQGADKEAAGVKRLKKVNHLFSEPRRLCLVEPAYLPSLVLLCCNRRLLPLTSSRGRHSSTSPK